MKRKYFLALIVLLIMGFATTQAMAFSLGGYSGGVEFKFSDFTEGTLHDSSSAGYDQNDGVADSYSIFKIATLKSDDSASTTLWYDTKDGEELVGIFYGIDDDWWEVDADGIEIQSIGGQIDFYLQDSGIFDAGDGPLPTGSDPNNGLYPTIGTDTSSQLFFSALLVPGTLSTNGITADDHITYRNTLDAVTSPFTGDGSFYMSIIEDEGLYWEKFNTDGYGGGLDDSGNIIPTSDLWAQFDSVSRDVTDPEYYKQYGWLATSEDPVRGRVPEPGVMFMLLCGVLGLGMIGRKKK